MCHGKWEGPKQLFQSGARNRGSEANGVHNVPTNAEKEDKAEIKIEKYVHVQN